MITLTYLTFDTYHVYETDGKGGRAYFLPNMPCAECGSPGVVLLSSACLQCGDMHSAVYCADSYTERGDGTALKLHEQSFVCRRCELFDSLARSLIDRSALQ